MVLGTFIAFGIGCGGDSTGSTATIAGTYDLVTINGHPLPWSSSTSTIKTESTTLTFHGSSIARRAVVSIEGSSTPLVIVDTLPYSLSGSTITIPTLVPPPETGTIDGSVLTMHFHYTADSVQIYHRR